MITQTQESLNQPTKMPLKNLIKSVPKNARAWYKHELGGYEHIPYGRLIHEALAEIERLETLCEQETK
jgi:hypothetical protein